MPELLNPQEQGFETAGSTDWEPVDSAFVGVARTTAQAHSGSASLEYTTINLPSDAHKLQIRPIRPIIGVIVGTTYTLRAWVKAADLFVGRGANIQLAFADAGGTETAVASATSSSIDAWRRLSCSAVAPAGAVRVIPYIAFGGSYTTPESDQWVDDVTLDGVLAVGGWTVGSVAF